MMNTLLHTNLEEAKLDGITEFDVILVSADAYVDHPAFAAAIIGRFIQSLDLNVGIISQPNWHSAEAFKVLGKPRLFFGVTAGNLDSMVNLYTAQRKKRSTDPYSENGKLGMRPYLPTIVYTNRLKEAWKDIPVIIGGIEASLRRTAHYDYYSDKVRPSILLDSKADMLVYGNGEAPVKEIIERLKNGQSIAEMKDIRGTTVPLKQSEKTSAGDTVILPSFESVRENKSTFAEMMSLIIKNHNPYNAAPLYQDTGSRAILVNPPSIPLTSSELDQIYELPFTRKPHPSYTEGIPALKVVETSIVANRGCYGGCSFCSLYLHQGKFVQSRTKDSIIREVSLLAEKWNNKLIVTDVGGPTANMYSTFCKHPSADKSCRRLSCLAPSICKNLSTSHEGFIDLLKTLRTAPGVKKVFISSGIRSDLALADPTFIKELAVHHTSGQLSAAPEHCDSRVLKIMGKPGIEVYEKFAKIFYDESRKAGKKQYIIPYFIVGHPGADEKSEKSLKDFILKNKIKVEQIQEFYPTPMSISTTAYYTGINILTGENVQVEKKLGIKKRWKENALGPQRHKRR